MWPSNLKAIGTRMLPIYDLPTLEINKIRMACAYLFSPEKTRDDEFLKNLKFELVRHAFTEKAKQYHPDLHHHEPPQMIERRRERFIKIRESYEILKKYIHEEPYLSTMKREYKRTVIAVGGQREESVRASFQPISGFSSPVREIERSSSIWTSGAPIFTFTWGKLPFRIALMTSCHKKSPNLKMS